MHISITTLVSLQLLQISGIFLLGEVFFTQMLLATLFVILTSIYGRGLKLYTCFNFVATILFSLFEFYLDQEKEIASFNSLMFVDKQSTNLSQFINRLLPLHVVLRLTLRFKTSSTVESRQENTTET